MKKLKFSEFIQESYTGKRNLTWEVFADIRDDEFTRLISEVDLVLDFRGLDFISNDGFVWIFDILHHRNLLGYFTSIYLPEDEKKINYLIKSGILRYMHILNYAFINEYLIPFGTSPISGELEQIHVINREYPYQMANFASEIEKYLIEKFNNQLISMQFSDSIVRFSKVIQEIGQNTVIYGRPQSSNYDRLENNILGFFAFSDPKGKYPWVRLSFSDLGLGFQATLLQKNDKSHYLNSCKTDYDAILSALLYRFYYPESKIIGLYPVLGFIRKNNGKIGIRSGKSSVVLNLANKDNQSLFDKNYPKNANYDWLRKLCSSTSTKRSTQGVKIYIDLLVNKEGE